MSAPGTPKASQAAITAVQEALAFHVYEAQDTDCRCGWRGGRAEHKAHVAVAAADAAAPHNAAQAIRDAADEVQRVYDYHCPVDPTRYVGNAAVAHQWWSTVLGGTLRDLRERADRIEAGQ